MSTYVYMCLYVYWTGEKREVADLNMHLQRKQNIIPRSKKEYKAHKTEVAHIILSLF